MSKPVAFTSRYIFTRGSTSNIIAILEGGGEAVVKREREREEERKEESNFRGMKIILECPSVNSSIHRIRRRRRRTHPLPSSPSTAASFPTGCYV